MSQELKFSLFSACKASLACCKCGCWLDPRTDIGINLPRDMEQVQVPHRQHMGCASWEQVSP